MEDLQLDENGVPIMDVVFLYVSGSQLELIRVASKPPTKSLHWKTDYNDCLISKDTYSAHV